MEANTELRLAKETLTDWPCFETRRTLDEITEGRMRGKPTRGRRIRYMLWQMMMALLHSNGQLS